MIARDLLRSVRHACRLSQRDLATVTGVPRSTIERIESGKTRAPTFDVIERILTGTGHVLSVVDHHGRPLRIETVYGGKFDRAARQYPAHLGLWAVRSMDDPWWGWHRIAFYDGDPNMRNWTYSLRYTKQPWDVPWQDAT